MSATNPLEEGYIPTVANVEVHPLENMWEAAYVHREGVATVFVPENLRREFGKVVDGMTPMSTPPAPMKEKGDAVDLEIAKLVIKHDPSLLKEAVKTPPMPVLKDIIYYPEDEFESIDDVFNTVSQRMLALLENEKENHKNSQKSAFVLSDDWDAQDIDPELFDQIEEIRLADTQNNFRTMKEKSQLQKRDSLLSIFLPEWVKKRLKSKE